MRTVKINTDKPYDVVIGSSILDYIGALTLDKTGKCRAVIISDDIVDALYSEVVSESFKKAGYSVLKYVFQNGERSKTVEEYGRILNFLADNHVTRFDAIIALGGGVACDLAGFVAATYQRGVKHVQVPTTLMAAVDSSVGGKVSVNLDSGKNLVGAFYPPDFVYCDYSVLGTLRAKDFEDGMAEVIKYGAIGDKTLFEDLKKPVMPQIERIITRCVELKGEIVAVDEYNKGKRNLFDFGHTFGHAIEKCSDYTITHGSAVAIGMVMMTRAAVKLGVCDSSGLDELIAVIEKNNLPTSTEYTEDELFEVVLSDKKRDGDMITLVVPHSMGECGLETVPVEKAREYLKLALK